MPDALVIAVLGAESTGKTTLAADLAERLSDATGLRCTWVDEWLRAWCVREGRTPQSHEQADIARTQHARIASAAMTHDVVVCDTSALMTAVYSRIVFGDRTLDDEAVALHRAQVDLTLLTSLDLPWVADGLQRDGAHVREPVDDAVREMLQQHRLPWVLIGGSGAARTTAALDAVAPLLRGRETPRQGLLTRLQQRDAAAPTWQWMCDKCDVPECEHAQWRRPPG